MLLVRIKEALESLYEDLQEAGEAAVAEAAVAEAAEAAEEAAPVEAEAAADEEAKTDEAKAEEPEEVAQPPGPRETDYMTRGYHLDVELPPDKIVAAAEILNRESFFIETITGVDWIKEEQLEAVYDFNHFDELCRVVLRTRTDRGNPEIPTISHIFQGANWHERETHDFFGIVFTGHPNLEPLLLPEDADFHPLLKDFKA